MRRSNLSLVGMSALFALSVFANVGAASAAPLVYSVGADYSASPFTFDFAGSSFTFSGTGDFSQPTAVQTGGTGMINTIFGSPTTYFTDRGTVTFGPDQQYGAFADATPIRFSNGNNFIGLSATRGADTFYGFAYTTNNVLNGYGFESTAGTAITATSAIPEPATWALMIGGFGMVGGTMRRRKVNTTVRFA